MDEYLEVELPDGRILEVPVGSTPEFIREAALRVMSADITTNIQEGAAELDQYAEGSPPVVTSPDPDIGSPNYAGQGFSDVMRRTGIGLGQTLNEALGIVGLDTDRLPRAEDARRLQEETQKYALTPSLYPGYRTGETVATIGTGLPMMAATRNPSVFGIGAGIGFTQPTTQENDLATRSLNAAIYGGTGLFGNIAGNALASGGRSLLNPQMSPSVRELSRDIDLTPGQFYPSFKRTEDSLTSIPIFGDAITDRRIGTIQDFNRSTLNRALEPIDKTVTKIGNEGFDLANTAISKVYDDAYDALPTVQITGESGQQLADDLFRIKNDIVKKGSLDDYTATMEKEFYNQFGNDLTKPQGVNGRAWGDVQKEIRNRGFKILQTDNELGNALIDTAAAMNEMAARTSGKFGDLLGKANAAHRNMRGVRIATASTGAAGNQGVFMPSQLLSGIRSADKSPDKLNFARGNLPLQKYAQAAQEILPSKMPDSGTPGRLMRSGLLGAGLTAGTDLGTTGLLMGGLAAARNLYRPGMTNFINAIGGRRPRFMRSMGGFQLPPGLSNLSRASGPIGMGLLGPRMRQE